MKILKLSHWCLFMLFTLLLACKDDEQPKPLSAIVPEFFIDTHGGIVANEPKINCDFSIEYEGESVLEGKAGIEYRGAASLRLFPKKSFSLETRDASGADLNMSLFEMPTEEDWVLQGPYDDKTLIRNIFSYEVSNQMGIYAPRTQPIELTLNGEYLGVYVFTEKIKRNKNRVDVSKLMPTENDPTSITGGYILKIDKTAGDSPDQDWSGDDDYTEAISFRSSYDVYGNTINPAIVAHDLSKDGQETYFLYEYPDAQTISTDQKAYIKEYIDAFETALANENFSGATRDYENYIDTDSFVDYLILCELSHNADAYRISTYLHKERGGKLKMGPIWDLNLGYGSDANTYRASYDSWIYEYNTYLPGDGWLVPFWWTKLMQDPLFKVKVKIRWTALRSSTLSFSNLEKIIDDNVDLLKETGARDRNFNKWPIIGVSVPFNGYVGATYTQEINYMKDWLQQRLSWMDDTIGNF